VTVRVYRHPYIVTGIRIAFNIIELYVYEVSFLLEVSLQAGWDAALFTDSRRSLDTKCIITLLDGTFHQHVLLYIVR
jgi:hypothetical protein